MAGDPQVLALIVLAQNYRGDIIRQINRKAALLKMLKIEPGSGKNVAWAAEGDGMFAESFAEGADVTEFGSDAQDPAILQWGMYRSNLHVSGLAMAAASTSGTPFGNIPLWGRNIANASGVLASKINMALYKGTGVGSTIAGLGVAIGSTTNVYAGIDRTTRPYFRPIVTDPGSPTAPTIDSIRDHLGEIYDASGEVPDIAMCPTNIFNTIGGLFQNQRRYIEEVTTAQGRIVLRGGYQGLEIDGCVFLKDKDATPNEIQFINTNHIWMETLCPAGPPLPEGMEMQMQADDGFGAFMLALQYEMLAKVGDSTRAMVKCYLQMKCDRPNSCGVMKNVLASNDPVPEPEPE
jgi:hypothetical protein